jgi:hypothetical protein
MARSNQHLAVEAGAMNVKAYKCRQSYYLYKACRIEGLNDSHDHLE